jgi:polysaccharide biosynthesis protein PslG
MDPPASRFSAVRRRVPTGLAAALLVLLAAPTPALAGRSVPQGFFGMNWDQEVSYRTSFSTRVEQWGKIAAAGAESIRTPFLWSKAQPKKDGSISFTGTDGLVTLAAEHGLELIPVVTQAPKWARQYPNKPFSPPSNDAAYARYAKKLVEHYGAKGSFWKKHPELPKVPVRSVQVWNEPSEYYQWSIPGGQDWAPGYGKLLRKSYKAIKDADPHVRVVLAGLPNTSPQYLDHLYKKGNVKGYFDIAAVHPYTAHKHGVLTLTRQFRAVMDQHGDKGKQLSVTELGLPASKGKTPDHSQLQTTDDGMAKFVTEAYTDLMDNRKNLKLNHVFFYTWASVYKGWIFKWTGLFAYSRDHRQDVFQEKPAYQAYVDAASSAEGCTKTTTGMCVSP